MKVSLTETFDEISEFPSYLQNYLAAMHDLTWFNFKHISCEVTSLAANLLG